VRTQSFSMRAVLKATANSGDRAGPRYPPLRVG
jgi:hypothetical protein